MLNMEPLGILEDLEIHCIVWETLQLGISVSSLSVSPHNDT